MIDLYYKQRSGCPIHGHSDSDRIALSDPIAKSIARGLDNLLPAIAADIAANPEIIIHRDIFKYTRSQLHSGIKQVFGDVDPDDQYFDIVQKLHSGADRFAGYKSYWQTADLRKAAGDAEKQTAINARYNVNWMRTEHLHTVRSARAAKNWQDITRDSDLYPYLEYMPSTAAEPRGEHMRLYGIVKPINDPFWDTWLPPADWGCRCSVKQVRNPDPASVAKQPPDDIPLPPPTMRNNTGKDGQIFTDKHPIISKVKPAIREKVDSEYASIVRKMIRD